MNKDKDNLIKKTAQQNDNNDQNNDVNNITLRFRKTFKSPLSRKISTIFTPNI